MTASIGITVYPQDGTAGADLLRHANASMYRAKWRGKNRFAFHDERGARASTRRTGS